MAEIEIKSLQTATPDRKVTLWRNSFLSIIDHLASTSAGFPFSFTMPRWMVHMPPFSWVCGHLFGEIPKNDWNSGTIPIKI